jgi:hypothetical protein
VPSPIPLGSWLCSERLFRQLGLWQRFNVLSLVAVRREARQVLVNVWPTQRQLLLDVPSGVAMPDQLPRPAGHPENRPARRRRPPR